MAKGNGLSRRDFLKRTGAAAAPAAAAKVPGTADAAPPDNWSEPPPDKSGLPTPEDPDYEAFKTNVATVLHTPYIRRDAAAPHGAIGTKGVEDDLTPIEFMDGVLASLFVPQDERQDIIDNAASVLMGEPSDEKSPAGSMGRGLANQLLGVMRSQSPGGDKALDASVSPEQFAQWQQESGNDANFRLTNAGAENFRRQAAYDLLRTMQDGEHAPPYANFISRGLSWAGGWFDKDTSDNYNDLASNPGPVGRAKVANRWWTQAQAGNGSNPAFRGDAFTNNAHYPGWSSTTLEGLGRIMSEDTSNLMARSTVPLRRFFSPSERDRLTTGAVNLTGGNILNDLSDIGFRFNTANEIDRNLKRTTPINPGLSPDELRGMIAKRRELEQKGEHYERSFWPDVQAGYDKATGATTPRTWGTPLTESVMQIPKETLGDPVMAASTLLTSGAGAGMGALAGAARGTTALGRLASAGKGAIRGAGKGMYAAGADAITDAPFDVATGQAISAGAYDSIGDWARDMVTPFSENALMGSVRPDDPELAGKREYHMRRYDDDWNRMIFDWDKAKRQGLPAQNR